VATTAERRLPQRHRFAGASQFENKKMTAISSTSAQPAGSGMLGGFIRWIGVLANGLAAYLERRAATKALHDLDDRGLRDIGIARCQIETAVYGCTNPDLGRF
jgi:uncharacterized protein YjiS (DUF1127 family)